MHKLVFVIAATVALLLTGFLQWNAKATPMTAAATAHPKTNASLVERAGCWLPGNCTVGQYQLCDRRGALQVYQLSWLVSLAAVQAYAVDEE